MAIPAFPARCSTRVPRRSCVFTQIANANFRRLNHFRTQIHLPRPAATLSSNWMHVPALSFFEHPPRRGFFPEDVFLNRQRAAGSEGLQCAFTPCLQPDFLPLQSFRNRSRRPAWTARVILVPPGVRLRAPAPSFRPARQKGVRRKFTMNPVPKSAPTARRRFRPPPCYPEIYCFF